MIFNFYKTQMTKYGESYASGLYLLAAFLLAICGDGLGKSFDMIAGSFYFVCDTGILILQYLKKSQRTRSVLLFGGSFAGSLILLAGGIFDDFYHAQTTVEWLGAIIRFLSNAILVFASFAGLMTLFPGIKTSLPKNPGSYYMASYFLFALFAIVQYLHKPSIMSFGYIIATLLWLLASNAIRLKYDQGSIKSV